MSVSLGTLMLHGDKQKIGHEKNLTMIWIAGRATHRFIATIGGARGMEVTTKGSGRHVSARTVVVIRELMKISSNNGLEKMMQTPVKATQRLMTKMSGRRPLEDIAGKSGGKKEARSRLVATGAKEAWRRLVAREIWGRLVAAEA